MISLRGYFLHLNMRCFCPDHRTTSNSFRIAASKTSLLPSAPSIVMQFEITLNNVLNQGCQIPRFDLKRAFWMLYGYVYGSAVFSVKSLL